MLSQEYAPQVGGVASQVATLASGLWQQGTAVTVITKRLPGLTACEQINNTPVYRLAMPGPRATSSLSFILNVVRALRTLRPDVIHAHELLLPTTAAVIAKQLLGIPVVVTVHTSGQAIGEIARLRRATLGERRLRWLRQRVDRFVAISPVIAREMTAAGIADAQQVSIPNGIDTEHFTPLEPAAKQALRQQLQLPSSPIVIYTGRLASEKRVGYLVEIWLQVQQIHPTATLLLVGSGPEEAALQAIAGTGIRFVGSVPDVAPWLQAADLFVLPSASEGFSLSTLEALTAGLAVIATPVGAIPSFITHGESGWLVPVDDVGALQSAVIALLSDPTKRATFAKRGQANVASTYSIATVSKQLAAVYGQVARP